MNDFGKEDWRNTDTKRLIKLSQALKEASIDSLTKLRNRRSFDDDSEKFVANSKRNKANLSLIMLDLKNFKKINDSYGHAIGDVVLTCTAKAINNSIRKGDFAYRYGGDEFAILLPETVRTSAHEIATRVKENLKKIMGQEEKLNKNIFVEINTGTTQLQESQTLEEFKKEADDLLYKEKNEK